MSERETPPPRAWHGGVDWATVDEAADRAFDERHEPAAWLREVLRRDWQRAADLQAA